MRPTSDNFDNAWATSCCCALVRKFSWCDTIQHILVQRRADSGAWEIPAGACEPGQSFATAAVAELAQETGIVAERRPRSRIRTLLRAESDRRRTLMP